MTAGETAAFEAKYGYKVSSFRVAVDALAVYVNKDNPIPCLTLPQLSGIFSSNRKAPGSADIRTWSDLGLTGEWARQPITLYSRNTLSGTRRFLLISRLHIPGPSQPETIDVVRPNLIQRTITPCAIVSPPHQPVCWRWVRWHVVREWFERLQSAFAGACRSVYGTKCEKQG